MKKLFFIGIVCSLFLQVSCTSSKQNFKVGFLVHTLGDERWAVERDVFEAKIKQLGGDFLFNNAEQDERKQYHQAKDMIDQGIDVLVIAPVNSKTAASIARLCDDNAVKIIAYDIIVENCNLDLYVSFNNEKVGELMVEYALDKCPKGNYVLFWGDGNMKIAHWIKTGQMKILDKAVECKDVNVIYKAFIDGWSVLNSKQKMERILEFTQDTIDVIIASSDGIAQGVIDAYSKFPNLPIPLITGQDASRSAMDNIHKGLQSMTIKKSFPDLANLAADMAYNLAKKKSIDTKINIFNGQAQVPSILLDPSVVDHVLGKSEVLALTQ